MKDQATEQQDTAPLPRDLLELAVEALYPDPDQHGWRSTAILPQYMMVLVRSDSVYPGEGYVYDVGRKTGSRSWDGHSIHQLEAWTEWMPLPGDPQWAFIKLCPSCEGVGVDMYDARHDRDCTVCDGRKWIIAEPS